MGHFDRWAKLTAKEDRALRRIKPGTVAEGAVVELREVTARNVRAVCRLQVAESQQGFVAPNAISLAQASVEPKAWLRAIYADGRPVGLALLSVEPKRGRYFLWRFMIDTGFQGRGYGRSAIKLLADHVRSLPRATELLVSWVPEDGGPGPFYESLGFTQTGKTYGSEVEARLAL